MLVFPLRYFFPSFARPSFTTFHDFIRETRERDRNRKITFTKIAPTCTYNKNNISIRCYTQVNWNEVNYLPGISDHDFRSTSRTYVESFASLQIDKWRDMGDDRSRFTSHPVIVKFSLPRSSSGVRIVVGFFCKPWKEGIIKWEKYERAFWWTALR